MEEGIYSRARVRKIIETIFYKNQTYKIFMDSDTVFFLCNFPVIFISLRDVVMG